MADYTNSVPLGQAGTGAAFILPVGNAAENMAARLQQSRDRAYLEEQARQAEIRKNRANFDKSFEDLQIKSKGGLLFQPEISKQVNDYVSNLSKAYADGFNPTAPNWADPEQASRAEELLKQKANIEAKISAREGIEKQYMDYAKQYGSNSQKFDPLSWQGINDFVRNNTLEDIMTKGKSLPTLMEIFDRQKDLVQAAKPVTISDKRVIRNPDGSFSTVDKQVADIPSITRQVEDMFSNDPRIRNYIQGKIGMPLTELDFTDNPDKIKESLDTRLRLPQSLPLLNQLGVKFGTQEYDDLLNELTKKQQQAERIYRHERDWAVNNIASRADSDYSSLPYFGYEDQAMQRQNNNRENERFKAWQTEQKENKNNTNLRDQWIQGLQVGDDNYRRALDQELDRNGGGEVYYLPNNKMVVKYRLPGDEKNDRVKNGKVERYFNTQVIDLSDRNKGGYTQINNIISDVTGNKIPTEKLLAKPSYDGAVKTVGNLSLSQAQYKKLQDAFKNNVTGLTEFFMQNGASLDEARTSAAQVLVNTGKPAESIIQKSKAIQ